MTKEHSSVSEERTPEELSLQETSSNQNQPAGDVMNEEQSAQTQSFQWMPFQALRNQGQPVSGQSIQWLPVQAPTGPWIYGLPQNFPWS